MSSYLVISALGKDQPGIVDELSRCVYDYGGNISDSRMTVLGGDFAVILLTSGTWDTIAKLEAQLPRVGEKLDLVINMHRTESYPPSRDLLPYVVDVVALDHPGIVHNLAHFFSSRHINIQDLTTTSYAAAHTGTPMFAVHITVQLPATQQISALREEFMDFCDQLNLDAIIEPAKG